MKVSRRSLRWMGVAGAAILVATTATTASAATPSTFSNGYLDYAVYGNMISTNGGNSGTCKAPTTPTQPPSVSIANNTPITRTSHITGTVTNSADSTDNSTASVATTATFNIAQGSAYPKAFTGTFTGTGSVTLPSGHTSSACDVEGNANIDAQAQVTLTQPGLVTISAKSTGQGIASATFSDSSGGYTEMTAAMQGAAPSESIFEPAGTYSLDIYGGMQLESTGATNVASTQSGSASASITFTPAGARIAGPSGNAVSFVSLGAARNCSARTLPSHVTGNRKYASQIQTVAVLANGRVLKKVYRPRAGASLTVALPGTQTEKVTMKVVLRNGKHLAETASYLRCS